MISSFMVLLMAYYTKLLNKKICYFHIQLSLTKVMFEIVHLKILV